MWDFRIVGSWTVVPSISRDRIKFFFFLFVAVMWKNLVLRSPSKCQRNLALCCQWASSSR